MVRHLVTTRLKVGVAVRLVVWLVASPLAYADGPNTLPTPASELAIVLRDVEQQPPSSQPHVRYLTLYPLPNHQQAQAHQVVSYVLNATSRSRLIARPEIVPQSNGRILRIDPTAYTVDADQLTQWKHTWEQLAANDAYWHLRTQIVTIAPKAPSRVTVDGPWLDAAQAAKLQRWTRSQGALLRADYFVAKASSTQSGGVYYQLAGIPDTEGAYLRSLGVNVRAVNAAGAKHGASLLTSNVTHKPRRVIRLQGPLGGAYFTIDSAAVVAERDPLRNPINPDGRFYLNNDAGEYIAVMPNGLLSFSLYDSDGRRQNSVPDAIAKDDSDARGDGVLQPMISCVRCHRENGLRPLADDFNLLIREGVDLVSDNPALVRAAAGFYDQTRLLHQMEFDRQTYALACQRATGLDAGPIATALADLFASYAYDRVTTDQAAREVGLTTEQFKDAVLPTTDPILLMLRSGRSVLREQWESSFASAATAAAAYLKPRPSSGDST